MIHVAWQSQQPTGPSSDILHLLVPMEKRKKMSNTNLSTLSTCSFSQKKLEKSLRHSPSSTPFEEKRLSQRSRLDKRTTLCTKVQCVSAFKKTFLLHIHGFFLSPSSILSHATLLLWDTGRKRGWESCHKEERWGKARDAALLNGAKGGRKEASGMGRLRLDSRVPTVPSFHPTSSRLTRYRLHLKQHISFPFSSRCSKSWMKKSS